MPPTLDSHIYNRLADRCFPATKPYSRKNETEQEAAVSVDPDSY
jgi:hypothetical protein